MDPGKINARVTELQKLFDSHYSYLGNYFTLMKSLYIPGSDMDYINRRLKFLQERIEELWGKIQDCMGRIDGESK